MTVALPISGTKASTPPQTYCDFLGEARQFVASKGLAWDIPLDADGSPIAGVDWDLRILTNSHGRTASTTNGFAVEHGIRDVAIAAGWNPAQLPTGNVLNFEVQEFIKAIIAHRCRAAFDPRVTRHAARIFRKLFSITAKFPWELDTDDLERFLSLVQKDLKISDTTLWLAKVMNEYLLSVNCPLEPRRESSLTVRLAMSLSERKNSEKLPEKATLYELARIVFQEVPRSHPDRIRFSVIRLLILTGLRLNEILMLPKDCLRWESHVDVITGRPAGEIGGISKSLQLRYFAEKHEEGAPDILVEEHQWIAADFQEEVANAVEITLQATAKLRSVITEQHSAPGMYPRSDLRRFKTTAGNQLCTADLLFLVVIGERNALAAEIPADEAVAPVSVNALYQALRLRSDRSKSGGTLFTRYSKCETARQMAIRPHSLRHLMNTELFRLEVADTVITQQFGRQSVAKSYDYDHRSLAERLAFVRLPDSAEPFIKKGDPQELVAKMVVSGMAAKSHIGRSFKSIQAKHGDEAAFAYLAANSDGFHVTPYGFCTNSFSVNPCPRHLKCFSQCKHFTASGLAQHSVTLKELRVKLVVMRDTATAKPATTLGRRNQISHAENLLSGVEAALAAQPNTQVFPNGHDHSANVKDLFR